jgi:hypothetical protein
MFKIAFGWGLRRRELAMLDVCDFRPDARLPESAVTRMCTCATASQSAAAARNAARC